MKDRLISGVSSASDLSDSALNSSALTDGALVSNALTKAREIALPTRQAMLNRDPSVAAFWQRNQQLFVDAWLEWEAGRSDEPSRLNESLIDSSLRQAVDAAWRDPNKETDVANLWTEVSHGVYQCQFFDPDKLFELRAYLADIQQAQIPLRPPYGIALNRFGAMLDKRSEGHIATAEFQNFYQHIMDQYMRPIGRLLFPEIVGYDTQTFGFSIQYEPGIDTSLQLHSDASAVTLNINLNVPGEDFSGSEVDFYDPTNGDVNRLSFQPGVAMIHRGAIAHAAQPITSGQRTNMVLWLYGDRMTVPSPRLLAPEDQTAQSRWVMPSAAKDAFAPF